MRAARRLLLMLVVCISNHLTVDSALEECCQLVTDSMQCRNTCQHELSIVNGDYELRRLNSLLAACPQSLREFWHCVNDTLTDGVTSATQSWWGRPCCELALKTSCQNACRRARHRDEVTSSCTNGDDLAVSTCLDRLGEGQRCCPLASSGTQCSAVCRRIFVHDVTPTAAQLAAARSSCSRQVADCLLNYTQAIPGRRPVESLPCCDHAQSPTCRNSCRDALSSLPSAEEDIINEVARHCGLPDPSAPMWQCFLRSSTNNIRYRYEHGGSIEDTGVDGARLQCCNKAITFRCRDLCIKTYSRDWTKTVHQFQQRCVYRPQEADLNKCLDDVEDQCRLGCTGLQYCSNFNRRPTELYRSCTQRSDDAARSLVQLWESGTISLPRILPYDIPIKDIRRCRPEMWKAVACSLHIKPCTATDHSNALCKSDCVTLLNECLDITRVPAGVTSEQICNKISGREDESPCVSVSTYLVRGWRQRSDHGDVTSPCHPNPCDVTQICDVIRHQRHRCTSSRDCRRFVCKPGCPMGELLTQLVPRGAYVRIPIANDTRRSTQCYRVCKCGGHNLLHHCRDMGCIRADQCQLNYGMIQDHGKRFEMECNSCVCFSSEVVCTTRHCLSSRPSTNEINSFTGLPCNCPALYIPVCGVNGQTFPNTCIARCSGMTGSQVTMKACQSQDPCQSKPCSSNHRCVPRRRVCLVRIVEVGECRQYECVRLSGRCGRHTLHGGPACDTDDQEYSSVCQLLRRRRTLAYRGHCRRGCDLSSSVCGMDGNTYETECSAWAAGIPMDYAGVCMAVGQAVNNMTCVGVTCLSTARSAWCQPIRPPGACCPICAGEIRLLVARTLVSEATSRGGLDVITVSDVVSLLRLQLTVAECDVFAYPSIESDVIVIVMPITASPTPLQVEACMREAEKLGALLSSSSPPVSAFLPTSVFIRVDVRTSVTATPTYLAAAALLSTSNSLSLTVQLHLVAYIAALHAGVM